MVPVAWAPNPVRKKATSISNKLWEQHKEEILREYYKHGLRHVQEYMTRHYQFTANESQYNYRLLRLWKGQRLQSSVPQLEAENGSKELANARYDLDVQGQHLLGGVLQPATIQEEEEDATQNALSTKIRTNLPETVSFNETRPLYEAAEPRHFIPSPTYASSSMHPSISSRSASPYERHGSAASSYLQLEGYKRTASISSQSSAPSSKRAKMASPRPSVSTFNHQDDVDRFPGFPEINQPFPMVESRNEHPISCHRSPSESSNTSSHRPGRLKLQPLITRKEIVFLCSSSTSKPTTFARIRTVNPYALPDQSTEDETSVDITSLSWEDMHQLKIAAEIFTACRMYRQAFKMHYQIWSRLRDSESCPWGDADELMLKQMLACSRTPETNLDLRTCRTMLFEQLKRQRIGGDTSGTLRLRMALADICVKQGDWNGAREHRAPACEMLREVDDLPEPSTGNAAPDFIADHVVLRAYALRASMESHLRKTKRSSKSRKQEEKQSMHDAVPKVWSQLASAQRPGILKILRWCHNQLLSVKRDDLTFLRECFGSEPSSTPAMKQLNVAALFGLFLMRKHNTSPQHDFTNAETIFGSTSYLSHGLDCMAVSSAADVLWIMAVVIVECMRATTIASVLSNNYFAEARKITTGLIKMDWDSLSHRIFSAINTELSPLDVEQLGQPHRPTPDDPCLGAAGRLVMAIVRREFGVVLDGLPLPVQETYRPIFSPTYHAMSLGLSPATDGTLRSQPTGDAKFITQRSDDSTIADHTSTSRSDLSSPWSSMKRIKGQMKNPSSSSWKDSMPMVPTKFIRETWRKTFGRLPSVDGLSESLASTSISDFQSPQELAKLGMDLNSSSRYKTGLTLRTLRDIHELVDRYFLEY